MQNGGDALPFGARLNEGRGARGGTAGWVGSVHLIDCPFGAG
jgi:hypothetical protein